MTNITICSAKCGHQKSPLRKALVRAGLSLCLSLITSLVYAQGYGFSAPGGYGIKIYKVESALYPFVQVYFRTFDQNQQPLVNLNERNIGLMVKGRSYDPVKRQYAVQSIRQRQEATRSVIVLDASKSMDPRPYKDAREAVARFIDGKRPQDEVAILAIRDTKEGYQVVSNFERDPVALTHRLADVVPDGTDTRLYDSIGAAMQMCGMAAQGSVTPSPSNYIVSCSIVVFSDGRDEGSAITREELNGRITNLRIPIPIYSLAYSKKGNTKYFKNLEAISKNSFGIYYLIGETVSKMQGVVENIQNIMQSDYVVTFRSYRKVDGESHALKLGIEYPTGSGKYTYVSERFEAIELPRRTQEVIDLMAELDKKLPELPDKNPFYGNVAQPGN